MWTKEAVDLVSFAVIFASSAKIVYIVSYSLCVICKWNYIFDYDIVDILIVMRPELKTLLIAPFKTLSELLSVCYLFLVEVLRVCIPTLSRHNQGGYT